MLAPRDVAITKRGTKKHAIMPRQRTMIEKIRKKRQLLLNGSVSVDDLHKTNGRHFDDIREESEDNRPSSAPPETTLPIVEEPEMEIPSRDPTPEPEPEPVPKTKKKKPPPARTEAFRKRPEPPPKRPKNKVPKRKTLEAEEIPSMTKESAAFSDWVSNGQADDMDKIVKLLFGA
ncbi:hypothetical protein GQR58_006208 [Nymphon striatum]|nr:hypothetical protein GQR58_006208 [Nymphon striatum]